MIAVTRGIGAALIAVGVLGYVVSGAASLTALLPAVLGAVMLVLGLLAGNDKLHQHAIHGALAVALLGALGSLRQVVPLFTGEATLATWASLATVVLAGVYIVLGVRSFVAARRARETTSA